MEKLDCGDQYMVYSLNVEILHICKNLHLSCTVIAKNNYYKILQGFIFHQNPQRVNRAEWPLVRPAAFPPYS